MNVIKRVFVQNELWNGISQKATGMVCLSCALFAMILINSSLLIDNAMAADDDQALQNRPSLMWLSGDTNVSVFDDSEYSSFLGKGEYWSDNWGITANLMQNQNNDVFGLPHDSEYFNLDVKRRFGSKDSSNFQLGLGWQELTIESLLEASGPKVSISGRLNLDSTLASLQLYGLTSYFPELEDELQNNDATAFEVEAGLLYQPLPSVSLKAGYRYFALDLEDQEIEKLGTTSGFLIGTDWSW
jgi:opacity protein-like surface antigen